MQTFILFLYPADLFQRNLPSGKASEIFVVDIEVCIHLFTGLTSILSDVFRVVIVDAIEGYTMLEKRVDGISQILPISACPDDQIMTSLPQCLHSGHSTGHYLPHGGVRILKQCPIKVYGYDYWMMPLMFVLSTDTTSSA